MENIRDILSSHSPIKADVHSSNSVKDMEREFIASTSAIPDLFFDDILINFKMTRVEIVLLMYFYRITWCKANMHKKYGIAPMVSHSDVASKLEIDMNTLHQTIQRLSAFGFIETIRSGQYFVRKYFTADLDKKYGQTYDDFL
jgi:DNA-binding MarR family transcriptional regulator